jgi:2-amino-4-hydroxy-6-hydroxymethyldihydropteridine diphosphokinase
MTGMVRAFVGLGGNLGDVETTLMEAVWALESLPQSSLRAQSSIYRSPPWGRTDQPDFLNAVVEIQTRLAAIELLNRLLEIEERFGRVRDPADRWGPRKLDLDLLAYGDEEINEPGLHVPHPRLKERAFVLLPLAEIAPTLQLPGLDRVDAMLAQVDSSEIRVLE